MCIHSEQEKILLQSIAFPAIYLKSQVILKCKTHMPHVILRNISSLMSAFSRHCPRLPYQFWSVLFIPHFSAGIHLQDRYIVFYFLPTDTQGGYQEASTLPSYHPLEISSAKHATQNLMDKELDWHQQNVPLCQVSATIRKTGKKNNSFKV